MILIDLNGLIGTVATSTAAIVAIVGGLLISRLLSLSSEKNGIFRRLKELQADLKVREEQSEELSEWLLRDDAEDFIREHVREIVLNGSNFEDFVHPERSPYRSTEELRPFIQELLEVKDDFFKFLGQFEESDVELLDDFDVFYRNIHPTYSNRRFYYETIFDLFNSEITRNSSGIGLAISDLTNLPLSNGIDYRAKRTEKDRLDGEIKNIKFQIDVQKKNLEAYGRPDGLWTGLIVIIYACAVGVIWPVTLLPYPEKTFNDVLTKWVVLGLFFSALAFLFLYLAWSTYRLTHSDPTKQKKKTA